MSSIRRLPPGFSSLTIHRAKDLEVTAPIRQPETAPVEPVRRGFSEQSDFQPDVDGEDPLALLGAPSLLAGSAAGQPPPEPLRSYTGASDFQARAPRYGYVLGTQVPPSGPRAPQASGGLRASSLQAGHLARPTVPGATLEQAQALAGPDAHVLLYPGAPGLAAHALVRQPDGRVTDPLAPDASFADTAAWERAHPGRARPTVLMPEDVELVLATPEGPARDEVLALFTPEAHAPVDAFEAAPGEDSGFLADAGDLPLPPAPEDLLALLDASRAEGDASVQSLFEATAEVLPAPAPSPAAVQAPVEAPLESPVAQEARAPAPAVAMAVEPEPLTGLGAEESLEVARQVAEGASSERQAEVARVLYARARTMDAAESSTLLRASALAASASPEATQALLSEVGEAGLAALVQALLRDGASAPAAS